MYPGEGKMKVDIDVASSIPERERQKRVSGHAAKLFDRKTSGGARQTSQNT